MNAILTARLLTLFAAGEALMALIYGVQTAFGSGRWLVLGILVLFAFCLALMAASFRRKLKEERLASRMPDSIEALQQ